MLDKRDTQGRTFIAQHDVRGALVSANASLTNSDASLTSLVSGDVDYFLDIIEISLSNASTVGVGVDLGNDGTLLRHFDIPASSTIQLMYDAPLRQQTKNLPWTLDISGSDITGTTVNVAATLIKKDNK